MPGPAAILLKKAPLTRLLESIREVVQRFSGQPVFGIIREGRVAAVAITEGAQRHSTNAPLLKGLGIIALLPEQVISAPLKERLVERVLPEWSGARNILHLVYPTPRGMLPSVRSLIDYLLIHVPAWLRERGI